MSTTFRIDSLSVTVTDPHTLAWRAIELLLYGGVGQGDQSRIRSAIASFPTLTQAQWHAWEVVCDDNATHTIYLPQREDAVYATNPEAFSGQVSSIRGGGGSFVMLYSATYAFHKLNDGYSSGPYVHNAEVEIYMWVAITVEPGGG